MRATDEASDTAGQLEEALQRQEGLQDSMSQLQQHLARHSHQVTIPTTPLVSIIYLCFCQVCWLLLSMVSLLGRLISFVICIKAAACDGCRMGTG